MKTLITGALQATQADLQRLCRAGLEITLLERETDPVAEPDRYEAVICNGLFQHNDISAFSHLKYLQLTSAGLDRVPADEIRSRGIALHHAAGVYAVPMAEWTVMRILEAFRNAGQLYRRQQAQLWEKDRSWRELAGKTACIVGFGAYGQAVARRLSSFGVNVTVVNRTWRESPFMGRFYPLHELTAALSEADVVILATALTPETRHMIAAPQLSALRPGTVLVNAARGALIDEAALCEALAQGRLFAVLDVFETEPLPEDSPLWHMENVLLSPHNSFVSEENHRRLMDVVIKNLENR